MSVLDRFKKEKEQPKKKAAAKAKAPAKAKKPAQKKEKAEEVKKVTPKTTLLSKKAASTIIAPLVSEKNAHHAEMNTLVFKVDPYANKTTVRNAFRELYKVTPVRVNIVNVRGNHVRFGKVKGKQSDTKKAFVTLPKGVRVDIFEGV